MPPPDIWTSDSECCSTPFQSIPHSNTHRHMLLWSQKMESVDALANTSIKCGCKCKVVDSHTARARSQARMSQLALKTCDQESFQNVQLTRHGAQYVLLGTGSAYNWVIESLYIITSYDKWYQYLNSGFVFYRFLMFFSVARSFQYPDQSHDFNASTFQLQGTMYKRGSKRAFWPSGICWGSQHTCTFGLGASRSASSLQPLFRPIPITIITHVTYAVRTHLVLQKPWLKIIFSPAKVWRMECPNVHNCQLGESQLLHKNG